MVKSFFLLVFIFPVDILAKAITPDSIEDYDNLSLWKVYSQQWHNIAVTSHQTFFDLTHANTGTTYTAFSDDMKLSNQPAWIHSLHSLPSIIDRRSRMGDLTVTMMKDLQLFPPQLSLEDIRLANSPTSQADWVHVAAASTNNSEYGVNAFFKDIFEELPVNFEFLVGYKNEHPVASTVIFYEGPYASLYWVGVIPTERRKGFGKAILLRALERIRRRGIRFAVLQAQPMGVSLYQKIGFISLGEIAKY